MSLWGAASRWDAASLWGAAGRWWQAWVLRRRASKALGDLFSSPGRLAGTSLQPAHRGRCDIIDIESSGGQVDAMTFQILRHPRPHPFSRQYHLVAERWRVELPEGVPQRAGSVNLSRLKDSRSDGEPPGSFP